MMPMSFNNKKKKWWQKLVRKPQQVQKKKNIQPWRNLSPDEPPLPFLLSPKPFVVAQPPIKFSSELDSNTSEIAPIIKDFLPSASLYISHERDTSSRDLYTIPELSEVSTSIGTNSSIPPPPPPPPPPPLLVKIAPIEDDSSVSPLEQPLEEQQQQQTTPANNRRDTTVRYSESECKSLFWDMLTSAMDRHQRPHDGPKEMHLLFDANDRIGAIRYISYDGTQRDQIGFAGTPQYIPPELVNCPTYHSESSHVWGLGISLYHMLVGDYPFEETTHVQTFRQMHYSNFKLPDTLSPQVRDLIKSMLQPFPSKRASFKSIQSHPWFHVQKKPKLHQLAGSFKKAFQIVMKGPYPPPSYYTTKKQ